MFSNKPNVTAGNKPTKSCMRTRRLGFRLHVSRRDIFRIIGRIDEKIDGGTTTVCLTRRRSSRLSISRSIPYESTLGTVFLDFPFRRGVLSCGWEMYPLRTTTSCGSPLISELSSSIPKPSSSVADGLRNCRVRLDVIRHGCE